MKYGAGNEQKKLLFDIGMIDFVIVEMTLYLDTHPYDKEAIAYMNHYTKMKNQATREYNMKYGPLSVSSIENCQNEWKWALQPMPWEGEC